MLVTLRCMQNGHTFRPHIFTNNVLFYGLVFNIVAPVRDGFFEVIQSDLR